MPTDDVNIFISMKIRLFTIPNMLTLGNLLCGLTALLAVLVREDYVAASLLLLIAALFDFCDGMVARLLGQTSEIGLQLDSLADMVSFGVVPSMIMLSLFEGSVKGVESALWVDYGGYSALLIALFSALRLAKFNIDDSQGCSFVGLPTPACAVVVIGVALMCSGGVKLSGEVIAAISVVVSYLLISPIRMFSFKLKGLGWSGNRNQYIFVGCSLVALIGLLCVGAMLYVLPVIMALYIAISIISHLVCNKCH